MTNYIPADKLIAEIRKLLIPTVHDRDYDEWEHGRDSGFIQVISIIEFLQREQPEVDLEKETKRWWKEHLRLNPENKLWMDAHQSVVFARHFYELGKNSK